MEFDTQVATDPPRVSESTSDGTIVLYVQSLDNLAPWFLLLIKQTMPGGDTSTFGIWIRSPMSILKYTELQAGNVVIHKASNISSGMSFDQPHEQNNNMFKGPW